MATAAPIIQLKTNKFDYLSPHIGMRREKVIDKLLWKGTKNKQASERTTDTYYQPGIQKVYYEHSTIEISVGHYKINLPHNLNEIATSILDSASLLKLEEDWDEDGANATNFETYKIAIDFIVSYSKEILNKSDLILKKPFIDITRDGSISIEWNTKKGSFLIIFKKSNKEYAYYYGQEKPTNNPFKYRVKLDEPIEIITLSWMSKYLT